MSESDVKQAVSMIVDLACITLAIGVLLYVFPFVCTVP